jgi:Ti-type conjugative transfer relaxase TraA
MAIEFARAEYVSRSDGKNACCKSAYNARARVADQKTNVVYTFERLKDNVHHEVLLPGGVNDKFKNIVVLANAVEESENRKNSQLYKEYVIALPDNQEITLKDRIELAHRFIAKKEFIEQGLGVQLDIHAPHDGDKNWHAHILVTTRRFRESGEGLGEKARDLNPEVRGGQKAFVAGVKDRHNDLWREIQNEYFAEKKIAIRVDEISATPGIHLGPVRMRAIIDEQAAQNEAKKAVARETIKSGEDLIAKVAKTKAVFREEDLQRAVASVVDVYQRKAILEEARQSQDIIELFREDGSKTNCWTSKQIRGMEERILRIADRVHSIQYSNNILPNTLTNLESRKLEGYVSSSQAAVLEEILKSDKGIKILQGRAGTGKSHVLGVLNDLIKDDRAVIGLAPTHRAAMELKSQGYANVDTVKGFLFKYMNSRVSVPSRALVVVDEAGMVGSESYLELLKVVRDNKASLVLAGDDRQLGSIEVGGMLRLLSERYGATEMSEIRRQGNEWGRRVSESFAKGDVEDGIHILNEQKKLVIAKDKATSCSELLEHWSRSDYVAEDRLMLTIANKDVDALNAGARHILKSRGYIRGAEFEIENRYTKAVFGANDRIVISESNKRLGLQNGEFARIISVSAESFKVKFDDGREVDLDPSKAQFKHGYAATVYKAQGSSVRDVFVLHTGFATRSTAYVEMSRHVDDLHLYCNLENTKDAKEVAVQLSRSDSNISSMHYMTKEDLAVDKSSKSVFGKVVGWVKQKSVILSDTFHSNADYYKFQQLEAVDNKVEKVLADTSDSFQEMQGQEGQFVYKQIAKSVEEVRSAEEAIEKVEVLGISNDSKKEVVDMKIEGSTQKEEQTSSAVTYKANYINLGREKYNKWNDDVARIRHELKFKAEAVAVDLLGEPNKALSNKTRLRFGENGRLSVDIDGNRAGLWHDFSSGVGGDILSLIEQERKTDFKGALKIAAEYTSSVSIDMVQEKHLRHLNKVANDVSKDQKAQSLHATTSAVNELGIKYLRSRGISCALPDAIRMKDDMWHAEGRQKLPALIAFAKDEDGKIAGAQSIYLDKNSGGKANVMPAKRSLGAIKGSFVEIQQNNLHQGQPNVNTDTNITILAEGIETALSVKEARIPGKILCALGIQNLKHYKPAKDEVVIIAADNDGNNIATQKALEQAITNLREQGAKVEIVMPKEAGDFNDVLVKQGFREVQNNLMPAIEKYLNPEQTNFYRAEHSAMTVSGRTREEVMSEIEQNYKALSEYWKKGSISQTFTVTDFEGKKHETTTEYLLAVGQDPKVKDLIDYKSELGQQIQKEVEWQQSRDRGLSR